ncbi:MAG: helicase, partial [Bryobacteraceae bacterium]
MNLTLDLGDLANTALQPAIAIETAVAKLQEWMQQDGSPIRAIRRDPAREARYLPMPDAVDARLRDALAAKSIQQLYTHQAEAVE